MVLHAGAGGTWEDGLGRRKMVKKILSRLRDQEGGPVDIDTHLERFVAMSRAIESPEVTNTGFGSNVCSDGSVHCDSSVKSMVLDGVSGLAGVVCNSSRFPMEDAVAVLRRRLALPNEGGVVSPLLVVGRVEGDPTLISGTMADVYRHVQQQQETRAGVQDTVGVILCEMAAGDAGGVFLTVGSSSGGNLCRDWRRIGSAGVFGAGCWSARHENVLVAVMSSGQGERLIEEDISRRVCNAVLAGVATGQTAVESARALVEGIASKTAFDCGIVGVVVDVDDVQHGPELFYLHTTEIFVFGSSSPANTTTYCGKPAPSKRRARVGGECQIPHHIQCGQLPL